MSYYFNPKSSSFSNAYESALRAGYSDETAKTITRSDNAWFAEAVSDNNRLKKAEKVLDEMLDLPVQVIELPRGADSEDREDAEENPESYLVTEPALVKIKQDTAKFVAERMGKHKYSARVETTGPGGEPLIPTDESRNKANDAIASFLGGRSSGSSVTAP